jgi:hypothetical protein
MEAICCCLKPRLGITKIRGIIESLNAGLVTSSKLPVVIGVHTGEGTTRYNELAPQNIVEGLDDAFSYIPPGIVLESKIPLGNKYQDFLADQVLPAVAAKLGLAL